MPTLKQAHLQFAQANRTKPKLQKSLLCQRTTTQQMDRQTTYRKEERRHNRKNKPSISKTELDSYLIIKAKMDGENNNNNDRPRIGFRT